MRLLEIHIEVINFERSIDLYMSLIDYVKIDIFDSGNTVALILQDGTAFGIWKKGTRGMFNGGGGSHVHFGFQIEPEKYQEYKQRILDAGLEPLEHVWPEGEKSVYFYDHDGHLGEFMTCDWN